MSEKPGRYQRSFTGLVGAMVVLVLVVGGYALLRSLNSDDPVSPVKAEDFLTPAKYARTAADFPLLAPDQLPDGWIATSVRFTQGEEQAWHLGCLTDDDRYVGLEQADRPVSDMVDDFVDPDAEQGADVTIDGETWERWSDAGGDLALVRQDDDVTTMVVGHAPEQTLREFIATLR